MCCDLTRWRTSTPGTQSSSRFWTQIFQSWFGEWGPLLWTGRPPDLAPLILCEDHRHLCRYRWKHVFLRNLQTWTPYACAYMFAISKIFRSRSEKTKPHVREWSIQQEWLRQAPLFLSFCSGSAAIRRLSPHCARRRGQKTEGKLRVFRECPSSELLPGTSLKFGFQNDSDFRENILFSSTSNDIPYLLQDNRNQVLYANMWITLVSSVFFLWRLSLTEILPQRWFDHRFVWSPKKFGNFSKVRASVREIWIPDIMLYNRWERRSSDSCYVKMKNIELFFKSTDTYRYACCWVIVKKCGLVRSLRSYVAVCMTVWACKKRTNAKRKQKILFW